MKFYYSPLRYPGGKAKVSEYFKQIIKDNLLYDTAYIEPYAGGASVAIDLLLNEYVRSITINDKDRAIYAFWFSVLKRTEELCRLISDTPVNVSNWEKQKAIHSNSKKESLLRLGFATFFLNRTNRSGILNAGVIGGKEQTGNWKIDARYNKADLIKRIERIAEYKGKIKLCQLDALDLIAEVKSNKETSLFYLDPPYYVKGKDLYLNYYEDYDHLQISKAISKVKKHYWVISYDNVKRIRDLYPDYRKRIYTLNYSAAGAGKGDEVMIFSNNLYIPKISPVNANI